MNHSELIKKIRENIIGEKHPITTPFGSKPLVYADYTVSDCSLKFIEDKIHIAVPANLEGGK